MILLSLYALAIKISNCKGAQDFASTLSQRLNFVHRILYAQIKLVYISMFVLIASLCFVNLALLKSLMKQTHRIKSVLALNAKVLEV